MHIITYFRSYDSIICERNGEREVNAYGTELERNVKERLLTSNFYSREINKEESNKRRYRR